MHSNMVLAVSAVVISILSTIQAENPGLKLRVTQGGFKRGADIAVNILSQSVTGQKIPDQRGDAHMAVGKVDYELNGMHITSFTKPSSTVSTRAQTGITWDAAGAAVSLEGNWKYKYRLGFIKISDHGSFTVSVSRVHFKLSVILKKDAYSRPSIKATGCSSDIGKVDVKFHGGASWLYNLFSHYVEKAIKGKIIDIMCKAAENAVNVNAAKALAKMKVTTKLGHQLLLNYSLVADPAFTQSFMESFHKGEVFWNADPHTEAPIKAPALPADTDTHSMLYVWMNDYTLNTLGYVAHSHGMLTYNLTAKDLPPKDRGMLNTTCSSGICIGSIISQLKKFPHASVELSMKTSKAPSLKIDPSGLNGSFYGTITSNARLQNGSMVYLFKLSANVNFTLIAAVKNQDITAKITEFRSNVKVLDSGIGKIQTAALNFIINTACKTFVIPKLNELGQKGLPIPNLDDVKFTNPQIKLQKDALRISTDVAYKPQTLYFESARISTA